MGRFGPFMLALLALSTPFVNALLRVESQPITTLSGGDLLENERFVQEWTVSSDAGQHLESILVAIDCQVYVLYAPPVAHDAVATVRVTGDNEAIIQRTVLVSTADAELRVKQFAVKAGNVQGHIRTEILVHNEALVQQIQTAGSGDVVVDDRVLASGQSDGKIAFLANGSGDLFLPPRLQVHANSLELRSTGSGNVHLLGEDFNVRTFEVHVDGSGDQHLGFRTLEATETMQILTTGSGSTTLYASSLRASQLVVKVSGSGDTRLQRDTSLGSNEDDARNCSYNLGGSGEVDAESVICGTADITAVGSGDVSVTARQSPTCKAFGSGEVSVATLSPLSPMTPPSPGCRVKSSVYGAPTQMRPSWMDAYSLPPRKMTFVMMQVDPGQFPMDEEDVHDDDDHNVEVNVPPTGLFDDTQLWKPVVFLVIVVVCVALYRRATVISNRRKKANEQTPLQSNDAPVYI